MANEISEKRKQMGLPNSMSTSFMRTYSNWEKDNMLGTISIVNLKILRDIMKCSYEYLLDDIDTFYPESISIENEYFIPANCSDKVMNIQHEMIYSDDEQIRLLSEEMIYTLNTIIIGMKKYNIFDICDYDMWSETPLFDSSEKSSLLFPLYGDFKNEDRVLDGTDVEVNSKNVSDVFLYNNMYKIFEKRNIFREEIDKNRSGVIISEEDENYSFGNRLKEFRRRNNLSQKEMAIKIAEYRKEHNINSVSIESILRSYQNWENNKNKEARITIEDLRMLKNIMNCKYEYLLESRMYYCDMTDLLEEKIGVLSSRLDKINLIQSLFIFNIILDNELLYYFTFLLSDKLDFYYRDSNLLYFSYSMMNKNIENEDIKRHALIYLITQKLKKVGKQNQNRYIFQMVDIIMEKTTPNKKNKDVFWEESEKLLISAIMLYIWDNYDEERTFENVYKIACMDDSQLDTLFADYEQRNSDNLAVRQYKKFKSAANDTAKAIHLSVAVRLQCFA